MVASWSMVMCRAADMCYSANYKDLICWGLVESLGLRVSELKVLTTSSLCKRIGPECLRFRLISSLDMLSGLACLRGSGGEYGYAMGAVYGVT